MPLRRRTPSAKDAVSPKASSPNEPSSAAESASKTYVHNQVKPRCVQHRLFNVDISDSDHAFTFTISEATRLKSAASYRWTREDIQLPHSELVSSVSSRLIGTPVVIACHGEHLILQCITDKQPCIKFIYANMHMCSAQVIPDDVQYFPKDLVLQGPVECHLSPDLSCALFTLPQSTMRVKRTSKVLSAAANLNSDGTLHFKSIVDWHVSNLQVRKHTALAFNPKKPSEVLVAKTDIYCRICTLYIVDLRRPNPKLECKISKPIDISTFVQTGKVSSESGNPFCDLQTPDGLNTLDLALQQCDVDFSKSADIILFSMCSSIADLKQLQVKCVLFSADTYNILRNVWFFPDPHIPSGHDLESSMFIVHTDNSDSQLAISYKARGSAPKDIPCHIELPYELCLQAACRKVIRTHCLPNDLHSLPLPQKLNNYIRFRYDLGH